MSKRNINRCSILQRKLSRKRTCIELHNSTKKAPKQFWTAVKSLLYDTMRDKSNCIHPNTWKPYFQKLLNFQKMNEDNLTTAQKLTDIENDMKNKTGPLDFEFNTNDITSAIKPLKLNKANFGIVTNEILQCSPKAIALPLCCMFNFILRSKTFPEAWNLSRIKPIHESGSLSKPDNYRGICISSHLSKLFTALLLKRLEKWTAVNNILPNNSNRRWNFYLNNCIK